jgi:hypothetical protein
VVDLPAVRIRPTHQILETDQSAQLKGQQLILKQALLFLSSYDSPLILAVILRVDLSGSGVAFRRGLPPWAPHSTAYNKSLSREAPAGRPRRDAPTICDTC